MKGEKVNKRGGKRLSATSIGTPPGGKTFGGNTHGHSQSFITFNRRGFPAWGPFLIIIFEVCPQTWLSPKIDLSSTVLAPVTVMLEEWHNHPVLFLCWFEYFNNPFAKNSIVKVPSKSVQQITFWSQAMNDRTNNLPMVDASYNFGSIPLQIIIKNDCFRS